MHITTSVSRTLNILGIMLKNIALFIITLLVRWYVRVGILLTRGKHLHDRTISLRGEVWNHKTSLMPPLFVEIHVTSE